MRRAKNLSNQSVAQICDQFGVVTNKAAARQKLKKNPDANEWIPTEAVKTIQRIREKHKGQMSEWCISELLYDFNSIWRNIMRKEVNAVQKKLTLQIQDLRRQLVTKKAFDEDESQREISRLKKEI